MIISVEVDPPTRSDRGISWAVGSVVATIGVVLVVLSLAQGDPSPKPSPTRTANEVVVALTADQQTSLVYASWLDSATFAECMKARGFSREAVAGTEQSRVDKVVAYLGIRPQRPASWLGPAEARNGFPASDHARASQLNAALRDTADGGCQGRHNRVDVTDVGAVSADVASARDDRGFNQYLAENAWLAQNPADALLYQSHLLIAWADPRPPQISDRWLQKLTPMMTTIDAAEGWSAGPSEGYLDYAQGVAVSDDGSMVVVRVGDPAVIQSGFVSTLGKPMIDCGDVGVIVGVEAFARPGSDDSEPYDRLAAGACTAVK